jgi:hypothetical protein
MARVERLHEVKGLAVPDFTDDDPVRAEAECSFEQEPPVRDDEPAGLFDRLRFLRVMDFPDDQVVRS